MKILPHAHDAGVLLASYYFPPLGMGGVQRVTSLSSHLTRLGWDVSVLTVRPFDYPAYDVSMIDRLPRSMRIMRAAPVEQVILRFFGGAGMVFGTAGDAGLAVRLGQSVMVPDNKLLSVLCMLTRIPAIAAAMRPAVVITSSPPPSIHLVGWVLRKCFGVKWLADYRDVWSSQPCSGRGALSEGRIRRCLERTFLRDADGTVVVSEEHLERLQAEDNEASGKIHLIPNGYEEDIFSGLPESPERTGRFRIGYCGTLNRLTAVPGLFEMLVDVSASHAVSVDICGVVSGEQESAISRIDPDGEVIRLLGYKEHRAAVEFRLRCDAQLVTLAPNPDLTETIPGKVYEALRSPAPIIGVVPRDCSAWKLLSRFEGVTLLDASDLSGAREELGRVVERGRAAMGRRAGIEEFSWESLANRYDRLLREIGC